MNMEKALRLIDILNPHLPNSTDISMIEFSDKILSSILEVDPLDYLRSVYLMTDIDPDNLSKQPIETTLKQFMDGLIKNDIMSLANFYRGLRGK